ncbi:hypothetical protein [Glycomyces sp. NRRL B-16210]|uniref:hypothetical protein n=1 Tax=Glycomyces sp. NRRL B-16210 TaxID=1463821 RepID=UPI0004BF8C36|nr:hypothetical protein [Glycomyces sp. NRRL B-16210]
MERLLFAVTVSLSALVHIGPSVLSLIAAGWLGFLAVSLGGSGFDIVSVCLLGFLALVALFGGLYLLRRGLRSLRASLATPPSPTHPGD